MVRIKELRQQKGMKAIDLAYAVRIHPTQLSGIERRKVAASARARECLCAFLDVRENEVFDANGLAI